MDAVKLTLDYEKAITGMLKYHVLLNSLAVTMKLLRLITSGKNSVSGIRSRRKSHNIIGDELQTLA